MFKKDQFKDKVVIVTGAGGGIGRSHAMAFAKAGAKVVVNDLGSARDGKGAAHNMADKVVEEIKALGGTAVANYDSVADTKGAENIIKTAIDAFGRIDIVVNNAGILRDKTFLKMTDDMWDIVVAVHLKGTYNITKYVAPLMKEQNYGRIINTTSMSGLLGNFGQTNYSAAKAGIYGFTRSLSMELERYGVTVNNIAPVAKTRMTEDIDAVPDEAKPEQITPMVMYLASDEASGINGRTFGVHGQLIFEYYMDQTIGSEKKTADLWTLNEIHDKLSVITDKTKESAKAGGNLDAVLPKLNDTLKSLGVRLEKVGAVTSTTAPAQTSTGPTLAMMFQKFTDVFVPEKAAGFEGLIQFVIDGDEPEALYIKDGKVTVKAEQGSGAALTITTDKQSMLDMLQGKADPTKLFMKGKIKADKMPIMMKFNTMFNTAALPAKLKDLQGPASSSTTASTSSSAAPATTPDSVAGLIKTLELVFVPEKAGGFDGSIQFLVAGEEPQAIYITDQKVEIKQGKADNPKLTMRTDKQTLTAMFKGELDPTKAVMSGKIKADQMSMMMKFGNMFDLKALPKKLASGGSSTSSSPAQSEGINRAYLGRWFYGTAVHVKPAEIKKYAKATNEANDAYYKDKVPELLVPPIFPVTLDGSMLGDIMTNEPDLNLDYSRLVHGEQEIIYYQPLKPWDLVYPVAQITDIESKPSGETMTVQVTGKVRGKPVYVMNVKLFVRAKGGSKSGKKPNEEKDLGKPFFTEKMKVQPDQSKRYAEASGDHNPIHLDPDMAKSVGLPDIILHGLCTMAFASQAIVKNMANNDPRKLKQINVRFSRPVLMNDVLTTRGWLEKMEKQDGKKHITFDMVNEKGVKVLSNGHATFE